MEHGTYAGYQQHKPRSSACGLCREANAAYRKKWYRENREKYLRKLAIRYHSRRKWAVAELGGKCADCGEIDRLQFDHVDKYAKIQNMDQVLATGSDQRVKEELALCQLLCISCHSSKTKREVLR